MTQLDERFISGISEKLGEELKPFLASLEDAPTTSILVNRARNADYTLPEGMPVPWCASGRILDSRPSFGKDPLFHAGAYYVQEPSSMFVSEILRQCVDKNTAVCALDLCAAPGGKSVLMLSGLPEGSLLVSNEVNPARWETLQHNLDKWGYSNVISTRMDPSRMAWSEKFDLVLVDAPCSGEGMFRKDMEARQQWSPDLVALCAGRQKRILHDAVRLLRPGGLLIYATCTFNDVENIDQITWMSQQYRMHSVPVSISDRWNIESIKRDDCIGYHFYPHHIRGEGFFCSVMRKPGVSIESLRSSSKSSRNKSNKYGFISEWIGPMCLGKNTYFKESAHAGIEFVTTEIDPGFIGELKRVRFGTSAGHHKAGIFSPSHTLALSTCVNGSVASLDLNKEQALKFLSKGLPAVSPNKHGWYLGRYHGLALGWLKQTGSGLKNYLPTHLRIRD